jgi:hypothetical protein
MHIPNGFIMPLYLVSFILVSFLYFRVNPDRRMLNLHFGMMAGAVVLMLATIFFAQGMLSLAFFALALVWFGAAVYLFRYVPPPRH